jgi:hypothetical protein
MYVLQEERGKGESTYIMYIGSENSAGERERENKYI